MEWGKEIRVNVCVIDTRAKSELFTAKLYSPEPIKYLGEIINSKYISRKLAHAPDL